jgi:hypothetical protein
MYRNLNNAHLKFIWLGTEFKKTMTRILRLNWNIIYADLVLLFLIGNDIILILHNVVREKRICSEYYKLNYIVTEFNARSKMLI